MRNKLFMTRYFFGGVKPVLTGLALAMAWGPVSGRAENYFNPAFLSDDPSAVADLSTFSRNAQAAGTYRVDVYLNNTFLAAKDIAFLAVKTSGKGAKSDDSGLRACLTPEMLKSMGINTGAFPLLAKATAGSCPDVARAIPAAYTRFDFAQQRLDISIPQAALIASARGYIPPQYWDEGINALLLNYTFTGANSRDRSADDSAENSYFLGLNSGLNLGAWRLRDYSTWNANSGDQNSNSDWQHISTYLERDVAFWQGELTAGDSYTSAALFDSLPFRGLQLASDDNMLPDSMKGFAPTIHGIAKSNAQVTIRQNGYIISQRYVPPGAFTINDLYPTAASGDLTVEVKESDGAINRYNVPYSAVPILQREGRVKYAATVAEYRGDSSQKEKIKFGQATLIWGLPQGFTLYGGTQLSSDYQALAIGSGANLGDWGAVSLDVTQAASTLADGSTHQGQSLRFLYAKSLTQLGTNFQLLGYRYSTSGFYTLDDTAWKRMSGYDNDDRTESDKARPEWADYYNLYYTRRGKVQLDINQQLGGLGSLFITGSQQSYWHTDETDSLLQVGYSDTLAGIAWSISYNNNKSAGDSARDEIFALNISVPLTQWLQHDDAVTRHHNIYATFSTSTDKQHNVTQNAGLNGTLLDENNLSYNIQQGYQNQGVGESGSASLEYDGAKGNANIGYNVSDNGNYQQVNYGLSGGLVAHSHGVTLSQPLGNTNILIAAPGAANVGVVDQPGIHTDGRGYAVVPYATTYRQNRIALDVNAMADDVDIDDAVTRVVPTEGSLVMARFKARVGARALLTLDHEGKPVPFGATVTVNDRHAEAIVDEAGEVYLSGLAAQGVLYARWGNLPDQHCVAHYQLSSSRQTLSRQRTECH
ncbi:fimbrial biogenesis outer membrane usher protein [Salmonella bongori]|uniref:fimbrial biogenesis usher protein n=1 Tax=Salmonella bongori TaxID=54736 RepID=UPI001279C0B7|nr:fimbrial biogenesis usher protein [Salmonella bongori]ECG8257707.1 fimbrial biogenesis outer membrane usher protein [Salmonella bongori serovar 48:i:-]ECG9252810.1 fimbrial biogenesis outer membrane usher protein [Salmonella bongori]EDP8706093.1 fimbrial biogenesis usher protein [Salmonella bongori]EDP8723823.1 fimbrial biogenesis usher protein [Salmonella bongori]EEO9369713.1 fimbrial biogenesis usher protein [Salmonella bongori]